MLHDASPHLKHGHVIGYFRRLLQKNVRPLATVSVHNPMSSSNYDVLVVGAGPAGLCLALALHKHGCPDVVVVDGVLQGENTSRAAAVHAATIEVCCKFSQSLGLQPISVRL